MTERPKSGGRLPFSTILVTGADGFVGRYLTQALPGRLAPDAKLFCAVKRHVIPPIEGETIAFDLEDPASIAAAIRRIRPDLVIHLAGQASVGESQGAALKTWRLNFSGALALGAALAEHRPDCTLLFVSTVEVYGRAFNDGVVTEQTPPQPMSSYSRSKSASEAMLADILPASSRLIIVRPSNHTGVGQDERFVVPAFAAQIAQLERQGGGEILVGNLDAERDFMDVRDVVAAYIEILARAEDLPPRNLFNLTSGHPVRIGVLLDWLKALSRVDIQVRSDPDRLRPSEIPRAEADAGLLRQLIGWRPVYRVEDSVKDVLDDYRTRLAKAKADQAS